MQEILDEIQDDRLTEWVTTQIALGVAPTPAQVREFGRRIQAQRALQTTATPGRSTENSNDQASPSQPTSSGQASVTEAGGVVFAPPQTKEELRRLLELLLDDRLDAPTLRSLIETIKEALAEKDREIARLQRVKEDLKAQLEAAEASEGN